MRKIFHILGFLAILAAGVSCNREMPGPAGNEEIAGQAGNDGQMCTATFRLNLDGMRTKAAANIGSVDESAIRRIDVFEYDPFKTSPAVRTHLVLTEEELEAGEFHLQYSSGAYYTYFIIANSSQAIVNDILAGRVSYMSNVFYPWSEVYDGTYFPMSGACTVSYYSDQTVDIDLRRFMFRVDVGEIRVDFDDASWMSKDVFVKAVALTNVVNGWSYAYNLNYASNLTQVGYLYGASITTEEDMPFFGGLLSGFAGSVPHECKGNFNTYRTATEQYERFPYCLNINYKVDAGTMPITATGALLDATYQSYEGEAGRVCSSTNPSQSHTLTVNKSFYALAGCSTDGEYGLLQTRANQNSYPKLVVELEIDGVTHYYPVQMYYPQSNTVYQVNRITIKSAGSEYSNFFEKLVAVEMDLSVLDWTEVTINNINTGFTDETQSDIY